MTRSVESTPFFYRSKCEEPWVCEPEAAHEAVLFFFSFVHPLRVKKSATVPRRCEPPLSMPETLRGARSQPLTERARSTHPLVPPGQKRTLPTVGSGQADLQPETQKATPGRAAPKKESRGLGSLGGPKLCCR
ncbi:hypothetical protein NDU88_005631 [Pleurodeles waltl]|uniref:Uncharacterized protein n=1 Tax=Pleurodeles waltl TaxID=8319 RepID=A0AAV7NPK3_PLEWA|nr:hypothetical protein NDU88_005631 [Pleurodeles waltl]